jgi:hypothetical protein
MKRILRDFYTGKYEFTGRYRTFKDVIDEKCVLFTDVYSIEIWPVICLVGWCGMGFMMLDRV